MWWELTRLRCWLKVGLKMSEFAIAPEPSTATLSSNLFTGAIVLFTCIFCDILAFNLNNSPPVLPAAFFCRVDQESVLSFFKQGGAIASGRPTKLFVSLI